jgi:hypothetical protein
MDLNNWYNAVMNTTTLIIIVLAVINGVLVSICGHSVARNEWQAWLLIAWWTLSVAAVASIARYFG